MTGIIKITSEILYPTKKLQSCCSLIKIKELVACEAELFWLGQVSYAMGMGKGTLTNTSGRHSFSPGAHPV